MIDYAEESGKQYHTRVGPEDIGKYIILPGDPSAAVEWGLNINTDIVRMKK